jgi:8-oxo-dGTP diphosphatase
MQFKFCPKCAGELKEILEHGQTQLQCSRCEFIFYQNSKPTISALIIQNGRLLLGKRGRNPYKGDWDIIGGFLENGEDPIDGLKREVKEEANLDVEVEKFLGFFAGGKYDGDDFFVLDIAYTAKVVGGIERAGDDIVELKWFSPDELPQNIAFRGPNMIQVWLKTL